MKSIIAKATLLLLFSTTLFSFSAKPGGEGFEILLNNKVLLQKFGNEMNTIQSLQLSQMAPEDQLTIKYYHCGKLGKNRVITVRDAQNIIVKEFHYPDAATVSMALPINNLLALKKASHVVLKLYYSSSELAAGRELATISI